MSNSNIHFKYDISELLNFNEKDDEKGDEKNKKYEELRIRTEENIKILKEQIFQIMELSFKNKSEISLSLKTIENIAIAQNDTQKELNELITDIKNYKKITNERIEKIFKLLMMTNMISQEYISSK